MSKIVTIPTDGGNPFVVILGGVKYVYKPGETVEVPDGVALEIEEWERWHEKYYDENVPPFASSIDDITATVGQTIVVKSVDENGKPTEWAAADAPLPRLIVTVDLEEETASHTSDEIINYKRSGGVVVAVCADDPVYEYDFLEIYVKEGEEGEEDYSEVIFESRDLVVQEREYQATKMLTVYPDGSAECFEGTQHPNMLLVNSKARSVTYTSWQFKYKTEGEVAVVDADIWEFTVDTESPAMIAIRDADEKDITANSDINYRIGTKFAIHHDENNAVRPYVTYYVEDTAIRIFKSLEDLNAHYGL